MIATYENTLIPPDALFAKDEDDEDTVVETEASKSLTRETFKNGDVAWGITNRFLSTYEQEWLEEAYQLGVMAALKQNELEAEMAYGRGVVATAEAVYAGRRA